jgi:hypothetical protein
MIDRITMHSLVERPRYLLLDDIAVVSRLLVGEVL